MKTHCYSGAMYYDLFTFNFDTYDKVGRVKSHAKERDVDT